MKKFLFTALLVAVSLTAREPYHTTISVEGVSAGVSAPNLVDLNRDLKSALEDLAPIYTPVSATAFDFNIRGIRANAVFPVNSTQLIVTFPNSGKTTIFDGGNRSASLTLFKDSIRDGGVGKELLRAYHRYSPIDPVAGNPNSLMASMGQADYLLGQLYPFSGCDCGSSQPSEHWLQIGSNVGRAFSKGFDTTVVTLPIRYSYSPCLDWAIIVDAPLTYFRNGGASSLYTSLGLGFRYPVTTNWILTPVVRFGGGGSLDLCTSGSFVSSGVTSIYQMKMCEHVVSMTNYAGYITSTNLWLSGVNFNYHLHNGVFKNGLKLQSCEGFCLFNMPVNYSVYVEDSYFAGDKLFINHFDEVGVNIITNNILPYFDYDILSVGFTYQFGQKDYRGYYLNLLYQF